MLPRKHGSLRDHSMLQLTLPLATAPFLSTFEHTGIAKDVNIQSSPFVEDVCPRAAKAGTAVTVLVGEMVRVSRDTSSRGGEWPPRGNVNPLLTPISPTLKHFTARELSCSSLPLC